jgi:hypothetical protein
MLPPHELLRAAEPSVVEGCVLFCGTLAARGGIRSASGFRYELKDPVLGRTIEG